MGKRWTRKRILLEFLNGRSFVGLARKYGLTVKRVEQIIRETRLEAKHG